MPLPRRHAPVAHSTFWPPALFVLALLFSPAVVGRVWGESGVRAHLVISGAGGPDTSPE